MTDQHQHIKEMVRNKYAAIALQDSEQNKASCCGSGACSTEVYNIMSEDYTELEGYAPEADLGLGCGMPTRIAKIRPGDTVLDLGSGAGNDCFVARREVGPDGRVIGVDFTPAMVEKARENARKLDYANVEFRLGELESMPVSANTADVVLSNCVLNLVPAKQRVFQEIFRVLKPGGHFAISDIVLVGELPQALRKSAEMYAGCVSGAIQKEVYLELIRLNGFEAIQIQSEKAIQIPDDILAEYLDADSLESYCQGDSGIYSITVFAVKPKTCGCGTDCCS